MDDHRDAVGWKSVPTFGEWEMKNGVAPDYSMDFTKIREMRKQNKNDLSRASIGTEVELIPQHRNDQRDSARVVDDHQHHNRDHQHHHRDQTPTMRMKIKNYFNCCMIGA